MKNYLYFIEKKKTIIFMTYPWPKNRCLAHEINYLFFSWNISNFLKSLQYYWASCLPYIQCLKITGLLSFYQNHHITPPPDLVNWFINGLLIICKILAYDMQMTWKTQFVFFENYFNLNWENGRQQQCSDS